MKTSCSNTISPSTWIADKDEDLNTLHLYFHIDSNTCEWNWINTCNPCEHKVSLRSNKPLPIWVTAHLRWNYEAAWWAHWWDHHSLTIVQGETNSNSQLSIWYSKDNDHLTCGGIDSSYPNHGTIDYYDATIDSPKSSTYNIIVSTPDQWIEQDERSIEMRPD